MVLLTHYAVYVMLRMNLYFRQNLLFFYCLFLHGGILYAGLTKFHETFFVSIVVSEKLNSFFLMFFKKTFHQHFHQHREL